MQLATMPRIARAARAAALRGEPNPTSYYLAPMVTIRSTYEEYHPSYEQHPEGRDWPIAYPDYAAAWRDLRAYLLSEAWRELPGTRGREPAPLAPYGHTEPLAHYGDTTITNDAETITLTEG